MPLTLTVVLRAVARLTVRRCSVLPAAFVSVSVRFARRPFLPGTRLTLVLKANLPSTREAALAGGAGSWSVTGAPVSPTIGTYGTPWRAERWISAGPAVVGHFVPPSPVWRRM